MENLDKRLKRIFENDLERIINLIEKNKDKLIELENYKIKLQGEIKEFEDKKDKLSEREKRLEEKEKELSKVEREVVMMHQRLKPKYIKQFKRFVNI